MPEQAKTWILLRSTQYKPGASLSLGQILTSPFEPSLPLLPDGPVSVPESSIERTHEVGVDTGASSSLTWSFKLWAEIDLLPIQGELGPRHEKSESTQWHFDRLDCEIMVPRLADVQVAMQREEIATQIARRKFDFKKRLYMITGVRIARGASKQSQVSTTRGVDASLGVDLAALTAAPVTAGPSAEFSQTLSENHGFEKSSDFVYAYRVCEIHYRKDVYLKSHNKGDTFGTGSDDDSSEEDDMEEINKLAVEKMAQSDYEGSGVKHHTFKKGGANHERLAGDKNQATNPEDGGTAVEKSEGAESEFDVEDKFIVIA